MNIRSKIFGGQGATEEPILRAKRPKGAKAEDLHSVTVPREESRRSNDRGEDRHRLASEAVRMIHKGRSYDAELINLSGGGAMVRADLQPKLWDKVELRLGEHGTIECAVRWMRDDRVGLEFAHETRLECSADEQAALLRDVIARSFPDATFNESDDSMAFPPDPSPESEQRHASRHPMIWSGVLHHDYQSSPVRVRNISATGTMVECEAPVRIGAEPLLELGDAVSISATVEWSVGDQVGLRFHTTFDMTLLARSEPEVTPSKWVRPTYLNQAQASSPWDKHWARLSVGELKQQLEGYMKR